MKNMTPSNFRAPRVYLPAAEPSRPGNMKLNLQPYDPTSDLRGRASAALAKIVSDWATAPEPSIPGDSRDDADERASAAARRYRQTPAAVTKNRCRMRARSEARRAARQEAALLA